MVLENGHRNDGWADFRDNHLIPEFKEPAVPSKWEFVKVVTSSEMAWGYTKEVSLRPPESRVYVEGGLAGLECKAAWCNGLAHERVSFWDSRTVEW